MYFGKTYVLTIKVPALFHKNLPPCNAELQVAYLRIVGLLRERWLAERGNIDTVELCQQVADDLDDQANRYPPMSLKGKKQRKPWRRETVFKWEIRWAHYFLREAKALTSTNAEYRVHKKRKSACMVEVVPPELNFGSRVSNRENPVVYEMWSKWAEFRMGKMPATPPPKNVASNGKPIPSPREKVSHQEGSAAAYYEGSLGFGQGSPTKQGSTSTSVTEVDSEGDTNSDGEQYYLDEAVQTRNSEGATHEVSAPNEPSFDIVSNFGHFQIGQFQHREHHDDQHKHWSSHGQD